jgi:hypothetical protein
VTTIRFSKLLFLISICWAFANFPTMAANLTGVWATDSALCSKVFVKHGSTVSFSKDSDLHGNGFIIEAGTIRGLSATCRIKRTKDDGALTHMLAACATDVMLSDVQLSVKTIDENTIVRVFPSMPEIEIIYHRCAM